jgi:hypothetical protein
MQIKIEKFLAFTAMLASAQLMNACVSDDSSSDDKGKEDSGLSTGHGDVDASHEGGPTEESGPTDEGPSEEGTVDAGPTDEGPTSEGPGDAGDASTEAPVDAGDETSADASTDAGDVDAATIDGGPADEWAADAASEETFDGGNACDPGPDAADEVVYTQCAWDACAEDAPGGYIAQDTCYNTFGNFRPAVADAFWDCYSGSPDSEDPCTAEADTLAISCQSAAIEGACFASNPSCETMAGACGEITQEQCDWATTPYNADYLASVTDCVFGYLQAADPDAGTEGCGSIFYGCIADPYTGPSVE